MIQEISITEILEKVISSYDCYHLETVSGWQDMIARKAKDVQFPSIVRAIQEFGFLVPICIEIDEEDGSWCLGNGHHRLAAAILLGLDSILVDFSDWSSDASKARTDELLRFPGDSALALWISNTVATENFNRMYANMH